MERPPLRVSKDHKDYGVEPVEGAENLGAEEMEGVTVDNVEDYVVPEQYRDQPVIHIPTASQALQCARCLPKLPIDLHAR